MIRPLALGLAFGVLTMAGPAAADLAEVKARGTLRVLVSADEQPEIFAAGDAARPGLEREMLESFARTQRVRLEVVPVQRFEDAIPMLVKGTGDLIVAIAATPSRRETIAFTEETLPDRLLVVTRRPGAPIRDVEALRQSSVGVVSGTSWADAVARAQVPAARVRTYTQLPALLADLRAGRVAATVISTTDFLFEKRRDPALEAGMVMADDARSSWGVRKTDPRLLAALNAHLQATRLSSSWSQLIVKYYGDEALAYLKGTRH